MNRIYYGACPVLLYDKARADLALPPVREVEELPAYLRVSQVHHEFNTRFAVDHAEMLTRLHDVSCMKRIMAAQHTVLVSDVHLLAQRSHVCKLRSIVCDYSDRTIFVLTTTAPSILPAGLTGMCMQLRVPWQPGPPDMGPEAEWVVHHFVGIARADSLPNAKLCAYRRLAYLLMAQCVPFSRFGTWLVSYNARHPVWQHAELCGHLAAADLHLRQLKKSILVWEISMLTLGDALAGAKELKDPVPSTQ